MPGRSMSVRSSWSRRKTLSSIGSSLTHLEPPAIASVNSSTLAATSESAIRSGSAPLREMKACSWSASSQLRSCMISGTRVLMSSPRGRSTPLSASRSDDLPWLWSPCTTIRVELISLSREVSWLTWSFRSISGRTCALVSVASISSVTLTNDSRDARHPIEVKCVDV